MSDIPIKLVIELNYFFYLIQYADNVSRTVGVQYKKYVFELRYFDFDIYMHNRYDSLIKVDCNFDFE